MVNLTPPGAEPHDVELSPRDVETVRSARLVIYVGGGFQPAVEDAVSEREGPSFDVLDGASDPHVWLDPARFAQIAAELGRRAGRPRAGEELAAKLSELDASYRAGLRRCGSSALVTSHAAFGHLADSLRPDRALAEWKLSRKPSRLLASWSA